MKKEFFLLSVIFLLASCVSNYMPPPPPKEDPAVTKLAEAAYSVSDSMLTLEGIRKAEKPLYRKHLPDTNVPGLNYLASVDWTGPIGPLVLKIAQAGNYQLRVLGNPPAIPVIISIHVADQTLAAILRNADYQAGCKADIKIYVSERVIELRYAPPNDYACPGESSHITTISKHGNYSNYVK